MDHARTRAYFLVVLTTLLTILVVYMFRPFLVTLGLAAVFAVIFAPLHRRLLRSGIPNALAAILALLIGCVCVAVPAAFLSIQLFREAENVYTAISHPETIANAQSAITAFGQHLDGSIPGASQYLSNASANLGSYARNALGWSLSSAAVIFSGTLSFLLQLFVFLITLYYFLKEGGRMREGAQRYSPLSPDETRALAGRLTVTINSVVRGSLLIAIIQGILTALGLLVFGVPNPVLWGLVTVIGALIPTVGTALVFIPAVIYLFVIGHQGAAIGLAIYGLGFVGVIDNFIRPSLVGGRASIHPLLILLSVLGGLAIFGPAGLFLGPLVISLLLGLLAIYTPAAPTEPAPHVAS